MIAQFQPPIYFVSCGFVSCGRDSALHDRIWNSPLDQPSPLFLCGGLLHYHTKPSGADGFLGWIRGIIQPMESISAFSTVLDLLMGRQSYLPVTKF
jgi:hypothetical protein